MRMTALGAFLLSFGAGSIFVVAVLWSFRDDPEPERAPTADRVGEATGRGLPARSEDRERASVEPARERDVVAQPGEALDHSRAASRSAPRDSRRARSGRDRSFDSDLLAAIGFRPDDVQRIRERWERAERDRTDLAALEGRGEEPPPGWGYAEIERELRQDLGAGGYDAMLYATHQINRVSLEGVKGDSVAQRAGLGNGSVVWSYDGQRVFHPRELAELSAAGSPDDFFEIVIVRSDGTERLFVEGGPLGAQLIGTRKPPEP
jgi:hypothetical protein